MINKTIIILVLASVFGLVSEGTKADRHFWTALGIIRLDEKLKAPSFTLKNLNGTEVKLEDHRGKIVFLNFWTTWCRPCREEMRSMEKLYTEFKNRDFTILAVDFQEDSETVKAFRKDFNLNFPILLDSDGKVGLMYGVRGIPATYLIDREGYVLGRALGPRDWASKEVFELIDHLLITKTGSEYG